MPQFQPGNKYGQGRPKGSKLVEICKEYAQKEGFQKLIDIAQGKDSAIKVYKGRIIKVGPSPELQFEALKLVLAYGHGKPTESVDLTTGGESLSEWAFQHFAARGTTDDTDVDAGETDSGFSGFSKENPS